MLKSTTRPYRLTNLMPRKPIKITPRFCPAGFRILRPKEEVEAGDFRWSRAQKCWVPVIKRRIKDLAGTVYTFIRRM